MNRFVLFFTIAFIYVACGVDEAAESDQPAIEPLYDYGRIPLVRVPGPDDPLRYDEIIWPWEMNLGPCGWGNARTNAYSSMSTWSNANPSKPAQVSIYTDYGPQHRFTPDVDKARIIRVQTKDCDVLDLLKYFPEVRELTITTSAPLDDTLSVLHYCPHLTKLEVWGESHGPASPRIPIAERSMKGIASLKVLRFVRFVNLDIDDNELKQLSGMKTLLYLDLTNANVTSKAFQTVATWPRIRYLKLYGLDFDQAVDEVTAKSLESLVGRIELLWMNPDDTENIHTQIHESLEVPFQRIRENSHLARQPKL